VGAGTSSSGLEWLWRNRRTGDGLLFVVHPWEAGNDHSPRWDDWGAPGRTPWGYDRPARTAWNKELMRDVTFAMDGAATWSSRFVACPAGFNAYVAFNLAELGEALDDDELRGWSAELADAIDARLWARTGCSDSVVIVRRRDSPLSEVGLSGSSWVSTHRLMSPATLSRCWSRSGKST
jgi:hypothetical protein